MVAFKYPMRHEPLGRSLRFHLFCSLAESQGLSLRAHVCDQHVMMGADGIQGLTECDEITGNELRALVNHLIKGMLAIGPRLTPVNGGGLMRHSLSLDRDLLAIALHGQLLKVRGKSLQVLFVGQHGHGLGTEELVVPNC